MNRRFHAAEKQWVLVIFALLGVLLSACGGGGGSDSSPVPVTVPAAPTTLQAAAASSTVINLTWIDASNNEDGFRVYRGATSTTVTTLVATVGPGITSYPDTGLSASTTYFYKVTAFNTAGESAASNVAGATTNPPAVTVPAAPTTLQATAASSNNINLTWTDASTNEDGFRVYRGTGASPASFTKIGADLGANITTFTDTTASGSTTYVYQVSAFNSAGESSRAQSSAVTTPLGPISVDAGNRHSLALKSDGTVWAWGSNSVGQLGVGASIDNSPTPIQITSLTGVSAISAGDSHSLALMNTGTIMGWGQNALGEVGNGDNVIHYTPVSVANLTNMTAISAGGFYSVALKNNGTVFAWGSGLFGQIGDGTLNDRLIPVQVLQSPGGANFLTNVTAIFASQDHTLALKSNGTVWAWGRNTVGEIGNGTTNDALVADQVVGISGAVAIAAGETHSLALLNDNTVWAWGGNSFGELGNGTTNNSTTPVKVTGLTNVKAISAGGHFSVALKNDGTVWAWGSGVDGQIGNGSLNDQLIPVQVSVLTNVQAISAGQDHTLSLRGDVRTIWAWGNNAFGQIGDGTTINRLVPVPVSGF